MANQEIKKEIEKFISCWKENQDLCDCKSGEAFALACILDDMEECFLNDES